MIKAIVIYLAIVEVIGYLYLLYGYGSSKGWWK
jgi:hypothetical protein